MIKSFGNFWGAMSVKKTWKAILNCYNFPNFSKFQFKGIESTVVWYEEIKFGVYKKEERKGILSMKNETGGSFLSKAQEISQE